ncbi:MAG: alpha/beta hydrolase-fold protein [Bacteroidota bacterium]|nr:alpha/beta hydrolase-fold protein [Bacteroidota bacterium]
MKHFCTLFVIITAFVSAYSQDTSKYAKKIFIVNKDTLRYRILLPDNYDPSKKYPVITLLHGSGERGRDNSIQLNHGGSFFAADSNRGKKQFIIIFPQCPTETSWRKTEVKKDSGSFTGRLFDFSFFSEPTIPSKLVKLLLDSLQKTNVADPKRMYIGGLSMGGFGTFDMIERYPDYFAAAFPICGGGDVNKVQDYAKKTPLWIFHGSDDKSVDVLYSRQIVEQYKNLKLSVKYTEYQGVGHDSWNNVFREKTLIDWLLSNKK